MLKPFEKPLKTIKIDKFKSVTFLFEFNALTFISVVQWKTPYKDNQEFIIKMLKTTKKWKLRNYGF